MAQNFNALQKELPALKKLSNHAGAEGFFGQESLRFISTAGTLLDNFKCNKNSSIDERHFTHIIARSLIENYFWIIYIFDDTSTKDQRYDELVNSFKKQYVKLLNEPALPHKNKLEKANSSWSALPNPLDVKSMMAQIQNVHDDRLDYLYFIYRITSFDTHGKSLGNLAQESFGKKSNFPLLDIGRAFELIANEYLSVLARLKKSGAI
ncbi:hypothetical protein [Hyphomonas sp. UBA3201]|uniref:hypothetical protein n=1 Tax=Hyphomonas sp. UBA3201 TaxID=1946623 RepID=UPI0025BC1DBA|nr:hypothetical protein [Hyphomonas sp. UBA3201]|tara:strand:+ start:286 stop:909 length:624 start_codon:yes stop_codon:yes gene_type:complete